MAYREPRKAFPDIWDWISGLPPPSEWKADTLSLKLCSSSAATQPSLLFAVRKSHDHRLLPRTLIFSLLADFRFPISLWTSDPCSTDYNNNLNDRTENGILYALFLNIVSDILQYGPAEKIEPATIRTQIDSTLAKSADFKEMFKCAFVCLCMCVCVYEAPTEIRSWCLEEMEAEFEGLTQKKNIPAKLLLQALGTDIEERLMRSMGLMITNRMFESLFANFPQNEDAHWEKSAHMSTPLKYSYSDSRIRGFWKVRVYAPILCAKDTKSQGSSTRDQLIPAPKDERLMFALRYQQVEAVVQFRYSLNFNKDWIDVQVSVDNVRCDVSPLVSAAVMEERGIPQEKHFPSRISLYVAPERPSEVLMVSVSKSSDNPAREVSSESTLETGFELPSTYGVMKMQNTEGWVMSIKPWKYEQSVSGNGGRYEWVLHDPNNGKQVASSKPSKVASSKPSKVAMLQPRAWFKDRYSTAYRPFTKHGGIVFAGDEYSECISWRVKRALEGHVMRWKVGGRIWVTYWPNEHRTFYCETRSVDFFDQVDLPLCQPSFRAP